MNLIRLEEKFYSYTVAFFLYATLVVDLFRKIGGGRIDISMVRNVIYVLVFIFVIYGIYRSGKLIPAIVVAIGTSFIYLVSFLLNSNYPDLYLTSWMLFVMRLWPAYIIGRYTENWEEVLNSVRRFIWIAFIYSLLMLISPEITKESYTTIASNLIYVVLLSTYSSIKCGKWFSLLLSILCWLPMMLYGSRAMLFGILCVVLLAFLFSLSRMSHGRQFLIISFMLIIAVILASTFTMIIERLYELFPDSRTLQFIAIGDVFNDSNRFGYYERIGDSLSQNPFKMYGFLGDRIYHAQGANIAMSASDIESMYSHNVPLELCMNFGLFPGIFLNLFFAFKIVKCFAVLKRIGRNATCVVFVVFLGVSLVNMMVSVSYLNEYTLWLIMGIVFQVLRPLPYGRKIYK